MMSVGDGEGMETINVTRCISVQRTLARSELERWTATIHNRNRNARLKLEG